MRTIEHRFLLLNLQGRSVQSPDLLPKWNLRPGRSNHRARDASAQLNVGYNYAACRGVPRDDVEAVRWYRLAADQGLARAQFYLGVMYDTGRGVLQNDAEAARWYRLAAEQGDELAPLNLRTSIRTRMAGASTVRPPCEA